MLSSILIGDIFYLHLTGIQHKLEIQNKGLSCIAHVHTNGNVCLQIRAINDKVNI